MLISVDDAASSHRAVLVQRVGRVGFVPVHIIRHAGAIARFVQRVIDRAGGVILSSVQLAVQIVGKRIGLVILTRH